MWEICRVISIVFYSVLLIGMIGLVAYGHIMGWHEDLDCGYNSEIEIKKESER